MDAVKFIEEAKRMCNANISNCAECCKGRACPINLPGANSTPEERVKLVEEWAAAHPRKTRQAEFLRQWPDAKVDRYGILKIFPCDLMKGYSYCDDDGCDDIEGNCDKCRREFWMQEVE